MIKAIVFDFDGTILDTESATYEAFRGVFQGYGAELSLERWAQGIGTWGAYDPYADLEESLGRAVDRRAVREQFEADCAERIRRLTVRPGVMETLEEARRRGIRIGLATSSYRRSVEPHLKEYGLLGYFEAIHTADEVDKVKPDPALYRLAVESLGVKSAEAVAIEDSVNGLHAAKAAGLYGLAVPNELTSFMDFYAADLVLSSLAELPMDEWMRRLTGPRDD
jgi:HAD superfamily hydrolase (TIGR01509 family)